ncbi:MAG: hypothetical protein ACI9OU_000716 [Candidatus Promineifilaceae bacterium]|jgi:hypothetical protein
MSPFGRAHIVSTKRRGVLLASRTCLEEVAVILLPPEVVDIDEDLLARIDDDVKSIYRLIVFSDAHQTTDLLTRYKEALQHLRDVLSVKNAQQEAQTPEEALVYLANLKKCLTFMMEEIGNGRTLSGPVDLMLLFRLIAPDVALKHPNSYRRELVQFGPFLAPEPTRIAGLVEQLFTILPEITHPVVRSAYLHHELVRIHPFLDGNGRVSRMAKNWLLMHELYPPIFIYSGIDQSNYITGLQQSFLTLESEPLVMNPMTRQFFQDEARRIKASTAFILNRMRHNPEIDFGPSDSDCCPSVRPHK